MIRRTALRNRPGRLLRLFLEPKSLTREKTLSRLGFSQFPLVLLGLLTQRQALFFSRSLACLFCLMRELAIAAAMASLAALCHKLPQMNPPDEPFESTNKTGFQVWTQRQRKSLSSRAEMIKRIQMVPAKTIRRP